MRETDLDDISKYIIEQELYKNPDLDSWLLAQKLGIDEEALLIEVRKKAGKPFKQVINEIRVKRLVEKLDKTILFHSPGDYYKLSGFKSRTPFERLFKKETGLTLSEYIRKMKGANQNSDFHNEIN